MSSGIARLAIVSTIPTRRKAARKTRPGEDRLRPSRPRRRLDLSLRLAANVEAMRLMKAGATVGFDEWACGGTCGFIWASPDERLSLAQTPAVLRCHKSRDGVLSL